MKNLFELPGTYKKWTMGLLVVGLIVLIAGVVFLHPFASVNHDASVENTGTRFWAVLLQNSTFWLLLVNTSMFFISITTLAMGGWQVAFKRVTEAISSVVPIMGVLTLIIFIAIIFGGRTDIYPWIDRSYVKADKILNGKSGFLSPTFFMIFSVVTISLWTFLGYKIRKISAKSDDAPMDVEKGGKFIWDNLVLTAFFLVVFILTVASTIPWLWLMSIDPHWYSTMYSWYTFASTFVSGVALITLFVVYLKNRGQLPYVTEEHLHDLGKFMFAFSIFWTYLWFSQYMLIWYSNQPEETVYFKPRSQGAYQGLFIFNLIVNFVCPFLILMKRGTKRNYTLVTFMCVLIIFGHWIDFYQMVMPGTVKDNPHLSWFEFGIPFGFIGIIMWGFGRYIVKLPLTPMNHPFLKESMIHHT